LNPPRFVLDLEAVRHNAAAWRARLADRELWAVVKSDAYGCGALEVARASLAGGAARLVVFDVAEAQRIRTAGIRAPIVQVFAARGDDLHTAVFLGVTPTVEDEASVRAVAALGDWRGRRIAVHVAVDSGTGWSGVPAVRAYEFARSVSGLSGITWEGAWTHIAGRESMDGQMRAFAGAVAALRAEGLGVPVVHIASTGPVLWGRATGAARIGIGLFGATLSASGEAPALRHAVDVRATVVAVKTFDAATPLGYGGESVAEQGETIATLRIGYADGLPKSLSAGGAIRIGEARCAIAGAIGMNTTMVRVPADAHVSQGDEAIVIGAMPGTTLDEVAAAAATVPHQLLCSLARGMGVRRIGVPA
jgi:alanine racemase